MLAALNLALVDADEEVIATDYAFTRIGTESAREELRGVLINWMRIRGAVRWLLRLLVSRRCVVVGGGLWWLSWRGCRTGMDGLRRVW